MSVLILFSCKANRGTPSSQWIGWQANSINIGKERKPKFGHLKHTQHQTSHLSPIQHTHTHTHTLTSCAYPPPVVGLVPVAVFTKCPPAHGELGRGVMERGEGWEQDLLRRGEETGTPNCAPNTKEVQHTSQVQLLLIKVPQGTTLSDYRVVINILLL